MRDPRLLCVSAVLFLSVGVGVRAQTATRSAPGLMGLWKPVVGAGASYEVRKPGQPAQPFEFAVVGRDAVQGKDAVWVEFTISAEQIGVVIVKELVAFDAVKMRMRTLKAVIELPGHPPMALPDDMMQSGRPFEFKDVRAGSIDLGIQSVSTPAGTFSCEHYIAQRTAQASFG